MSVLRAPKDNITEITRGLLATKLSKWDRPWRMTPIIGTINDNDITDIDIQNIIEAGLKIVRFKMQITINDKIKLMKMLKKALLWCCEKYDVTAWPIAMSIDVPNACIITGTLAKGHEIYLPENSIVELTSDTKYAALCDSKRIFMDDPYTMKDIKEGAEIFIHFEDIVMICTQKVDLKTIKCKVVLGGVLGNSASVCIRGVRYKRPPLTKSDRNILQFAKEMKFDIVTINSVRYAKTLRSIRQYFSYIEMPLIVSTISEQEGLKNIKDIIKESDGIILAREFLACNIVDTNLMVGIQMYVGALCRKMGKPFYISGNILEETINTGNVAIGELSDITNAILQGAGFMLRQYKHSSQLTKVLGVLNSMCRTVEPMTRYEEFWRLATEFAMPVNAAEAAILSTALLAKQTESPVIMIPTVTGRTAKQIAHVSPGSIIVTISTSPVVAQKLQLYRGIVSIIYDKPSKKDWYHETAERIEFAITYAVKNGLVHYGDSYVVLKKSSPTSCFCDQVSAWTVEMKEVTVNKFPVGLTATSILSLE